MTRRVLVTGATGFLGTRLVRALRERGDQVVAASSRTADLTRDGTLHAFAPGPFDLVFHLAAWTQAGDFCLHHPGEQWIINQRINTNVLAWWQERQPQATLVTIGTSCSYDPALPLVEENYLVGTPIDSLYTYGMTKRMMLVGQRALRKQYGLRSLTVVPSTLYGPGYHTDGRQMHFIFDLIRKILRARLHGDPVVLWGDGHQRRELVFVDDFVRLTLRLADSVEGEVVNIGAGEEHSIREFARLICDEVGYPFEEIRFDTSRYVGARSKCLDVTRLRQLVGDPALTPLAEGLRQTIAWFRQEAPALLPVGDTA
jgi:GDP-L-fucose synthase